MKYVKPNRKKEAMVVFELCFALKQKNIQFDLEYTDQVVDWDMPAKKVRFDVVIVKDQSIVAIVECKRTPEAGSKRLKRNAQINRYSTFGVPVLLCQGVQDIEPTIMKIGSLLR